MWHLEGAASVAAKHRQAVTMVCDAGFFPFAVYLALQIQDSHPIRTFDLVVVCSDDVELPSSLPTHDLRIVTATGATPFQHLTRSARRSHAAYLCLMLPHLLPEYDRIAYLDCDMAVAIAGLDELLQLDLHGRVLGAVRDIAQWRAPMRRPKEMKELNRASVPYFNSGMLLIDAGPWRAQRISERCLAVGQDPALQAGLVRDDQSVINFAVEGRWCELSPVWNWQWTWSSRMFADAAGARLLHFIGPRKPWNSPRVPLRYTHGYHPFLKRHFPHVSHADPEFSPPNIRDLGRVLIRHRLRLKATQAFLDRFPSPKTTYAHSKLSTPG